MTQTDSPQRPDADGNRRRLRIDLLETLADDTWGPGEYVGQENFMTASEILGLARAAGIEEHDRVLDLACGTFGPGTLIAAVLGCRMVGVDRSLEALRIARSRASVRSMHHFPAFVVADVYRPPFASPFDTVLLLETMLSIHDKRRLLAEVRRLLDVGGRFALTLEEGTPLTAHERECLPEGDQVWLATEREFRHLLEESGFRIAQIEDHTQSHAAVAGRAAATLSRDREQLAERFGDELVDELTAANTTWTQWLSDRRVRKLAIVAERVANHR